MQESLQQIFTPIIEGCNLNMEEITHNQDKLGSTLTKIGTGNLLQRSILALITPYSQNWKKFKN